MSLDGIQVGPGFPPGGLRFRPRQTNWTFVIGLGLQSCVPAIFKDIDFAVHCHSGGSLWVYERGSWKFTSPKKSSVNSLIELRVTEEKVQWWLDGEKLSYSGSLQGPSILYAKADLRDVGTEVVDIQWL